MSKLIDAEKLTKFEEALADIIVSSQGLCTYEACKDMAKREAPFLITSLQQEETRVDKMLCSQVWWEEQGWIMIPPDATIEGIDSLLKQVKKKLQQEQPEGLHFTPLNRLIQKIPSENWNDTVNNYAKKLRDCLIKEGYQKDADVLQGYISYMNGNNVPMAKMDDKEQPEVDLEKEIEELWKSLNTGHDYVIVDNYLDFLGICLHCFELGLNARKV